MNNILQLEASLQEPGLEPLPMNAAIARAAELLNGARQVERPSYPIDSLGPLAPVARAISEGVQVAPATAGQTVLAAAALLTQGHHNVQTLQGQKPLSLALLTIAQSGDGKDTADGYALRQIHAFQRNQSDSHRRAVKQYEEELRKAKRGQKKPEPPPAPIYYITKDATVEGLRKDFSSGIASQGLFSTEAASVLMGYGFSDEQKAKTAGVLNGLFDTGHFSVSRAMDGRLERYGVRLSAHLMIQPVAIGEAIQDETMQNIGFWPRWLIAWPDTLEPRRYIQWRPEDSPSLRDYLGRCDEILGKTPYENVNDAEVLKLSQGARREIIAFFEKMEKVGRKGNLQVIKPFAIRAPELACRIAGVLTAWEGKPLVSEDNAECAINLVTYSLETWRAAIEEGRGDPTASWALALYKWLAKRGGFVHVKDIARLGPASVRSASRRDAAIDLLLAHDLIIRDKDRIGALGVRHG